MLLCATATCSADGLEIQECRAHVRVNLRAQVFQVIASLLQLRVGLQLVAVNVAAGK